MAIRYFTCERHGEFAKSVSSPEDYPTECEICERPLSVKEDKTPIGWKSYGYLCGKCGYMEMTVPEADCDGRICECGDDLARVLAPPKVGNWQDNESIKNKKYKRDLTQASDLKKLYYRHRKRLCGQQLRDLKTEYRSRKGEKLGI